jgi:hypothetical protein
MGFISFNEKYYRRKLEEFENKILSDADICEAKQLLKVLDDLTDEGYTNLNDTMEADFSCLTRLRTVLHRCGVAPFPIDHERLSDTVYGKNEYELEELLGNLIEEARNHSSVSGNPFLEEIYRYKGCLDAFYPSIDPLLFYKSVKRLLQLDVSRIFPGHHDLAIPVSLINEINEDFSQIERNGQLKQGKGLFDFGDVKIHI